ncbi:hypothetical protein HDV57DRAFT_48045 [Trichoderma longibrachiatum]
MMGALNADDDAHAPHGHERHRSKRSRDEDVLLMEPPSPERPDRRGTSASKKTGLSGLFSGFMTPRASKVETGVDFDVPAAAADTDREGPRVSSRKTRKSEREAERPAEDRERRRKRRDDSETRKAEEKEARRERRAARQREEEERGAQGGEPSTKRRPWKTQTRSAAERGGSDESGRSAMACLRGVMSDIAADETLQRQQSRRLGAAGGGGLAEAERRIEP